MFGKFTLFKRLAKQVWRMDRSAKRLEETVTITLDGFSLMNHRQFAKFAKFSTRQTFLLYDTSFNIITVSSQWHFNQLFSSKMYFKPCLEAHKIQ